MSVVKAKDLVPQAFKPAQVDASAKEDDLEYDLGNLAAFDAHPVEVPVRAARWGGWGGPSGQTAPQRWKMGLVPCHVCARARSHAPQGQGKAREAALQNSARDAVQLLVNRIFQLPTEKSQYGPLVRADAVAWRYPGGAGRA